MARKLLLIFASLTLVIAGGALYFALSSPAATTTAVATPTRAVMMAVADLPPGTKGSALTDVHVTTVQVPAAMVPANTLENLTQIQSLQAVVPVFKGQILMTPMFGTSLNTGGLSIPPGTNAVTVSISDTGRVAGFVQPGSKVVIYENGAGANGTSRVVLESAQVIAIGPTTLTGGIAEGSGAVSNKGLPTTLVTFALTPKDSVLLVGKESLSLGLLPS